MKFVKNLLKHKNTGKNFLKGIVLPAELKNEWKCFNLICVVRLLAEILIVHDMGWWYMILIWHFRSKNRYAIFTVMNIVWTHWLFHMIYIEHNHTPRSSYKVSAAGLSWLDCFYIIWSRSLRVKSLWLLIKALPSKEEPDISLSIVNSSYDSLLSHLKWPKLSTRRKRQKLLLCNRILNNFAILPPSLFTPHPSTHLRHNHPFSLYKCVQNLYKEKKSHAFIPTLYVHVLLPRSAVVQR